MYETATKGRERTL